MRQLVVHLDKLRQNIRYLVDFCRERNIEMTGILKGPGFNTGILDTFIESGVRSLGFSRLPLEGCPVDPSGKELAFICLPSMDDIHRIPELFDTSYHSQPAVVKRLNDHLVDQGRSHKITLMVDTGDHREGVMPGDALSFVRKVYGIRNRKFELTGIAANLGCCSGIKPAMDNLRILQDLAEEIEALLGTRLETVSIGGSLMLEWMKDRPLPSRINRLRLGEAVFLGTVPTYDYKHESLHDDVLIFESDVLEAAEKKVHPPSDAGKNALGIRQDFSHTGVRKRAILNFGVSDTHPDGLTPLDENSRIVSVNSNYTVVDFTQSQREYRAGDTMAFKLNYQAMLQCFFSPFTTISCKRDS